MHHEDVKVFPVFPRCFILRSPVLPLSMEVYKPKKHIQLHQPMTYILAF